MRFAYRAFLSTVVGGLVAGSAAAQQQTVTGPVAVYWMSAATTNGMGGMMGMGAAGRQGAMGAPGRAAAPAAPPPQRRRPGLGSMLGGMAGGGIPGIGGLGSGRSSRGASEEPDEETPTGLPPGMRIPGMGGGEPVQTLTLQIGSSRRAAGEPSAEHLPPEGLGAGASLPLLTPRVAPPEPPEPGGPPQMTERPRGRMLIYWGCGERAAAAPIVIDFAKVGPGMPVPNMPFVQANPGRPPSPGRHATYGEWPNERTRVTVPADGSLVGAHTVRGNYSPEIRFSLAANQDFLPPLNITSTNPSPGGGTRVTWNAVSGATGYYAWLVGAQERGETVVMWTSGQVANMIGALTDYLPPSEVRRLIAQRVVMPPTTTECIVPSEVVKATPYGMLQMIAYGDDTDFADPPRPANVRTPWNISWTVKVRRKSTTSALLGMPSMQ